MIKVTDIHKRFGDLEVLKGVSLDVARTNAVTLAPISTSASVRCEPMKPSAPVTSTVRPP